MTNAPATQRDPISKRWIALERALSADSAGTARTSHAPTFQTLIAAHPVSWEEYRDYLRAVGQPPASPVHFERHSAPVTDVAQADAVAYCRWLGQREGKALRLPTVAELMELASEAEEDGISMEVWPHEHGHRPELRGGMNEMFLCEWTAETEEVPMPAGQPPRILGSIFYPPWLRHGGHTSNSQAHLLATEGYSFVTFRVAYRGAQSS